MRKSTQKPLNSEKNRMKQKRSTKNTRLQNLLGLLLVMILLAALLIFLTSCETEKATPRPPIDFTPYRPPMLPDLVEVETDADLYNNWIGTQELLELWQNYAIEFLEPLITSTP